jgi:regulator of nonsense transcripts 1
VVRIAAKTRETMDSQVEHLTLHYQVGHLDLPGRVGEDFKKYRKLKELQGELNDKDEKR